MLALAPLFSTIIPLIIAPLAVQAPAGGPGASVEIAVGERSAKVRQRFVLADSAPAQLEFLSRPCAVLDTVTMSDGATSRVVGFSANGPWRTADISGVPRRFELTYTVTRTGAAGDVPLIIPRAPIRRSDGRAPVVVAVRFNAGKGTVSFPRLERAGDQWQARFEALPSFVRVGPAGGCEHADGTTDGGLTWRFTVLVGIMVAWVPLYLWWARRSGGDDA